MAAAAAALRNFFPVNEELFLRTIIVFCYDDDDDDDKNYYNFCYWRFAVKSRILLEDRKTGGGGVWGKTKPPPIEDTKRNFVINRKLVLKFGVLKKKKKNVEIRANVFVQLFQRLKIRIV